MNTLTQRILSALVMAPLAIAAVVLLPSGWVAGLFGVISPFGATTINGSDIRG